MSQNLSSAAVVIGAFRVNQGSMVLAMVNWTVKDQQILYPAKLDLLIVLGKFNPRIWFTVKPVLSSHSKKDKTKILMTNAIA